jgi:hypothetical protein
VLRNHGQTLIQEVFEATVVREDDERSHPEVRAPMAHCLYKSNKLSFVGSELGVLGAHCLLKNAIGPCPWCRTVSNPELEASQSTMNGSSKLGSCRTGPVMRASFRASKAAIAFGVHWNASFFMSAVSGAAMAP